MTGPDAVPRRSNAAELEHAVGYASPSSEAAGAGYRGKSAVCCDNAEIMERSGCVVETDELPWICQMEGLFFNLELVAMVGRRWCVCSGSPTTTGDGQTDEAVEVLDRLVVALPTTLVCTEGQSPLPKRAECILPFVTPDEFGLGMVWARVRLRW